MTRSDEHGTWVWFQLESRPNTHKITWPIELYLLVAHESVTERNFRARLLIEGTIEPMTVADLKMAGVGKVRKQLAAAAGVR